MGYLAVIGVGTVSILGVAAMAIAAKEPAVKQASVFTPPSVTHRVRENAKQFPWAREMRDAIVRAAEPWMQMPDDDLWSIMFGNTIRRSWMVWSNGHCPACSQSVPMYTWEIDALRRPWKVRCPHCTEVFPKNDFKAFYDTGLDEHGVFDPKRADRSLLFNAEHPGAGDPLRAFGVDDGEGFVQGGKRWRFIGAYLIYGQWKQAVLGGLKALSGAYVVTGEAAYARKAGILLDRVADLYPTFDFGKEGVMYEGPPAAGYVSTWHDACEETRELALCYDRVFDGIKGDAALVAFLAGKAKRHGLLNPKAAFADIQRNIEDRILRDAITNRHKIRSNDPRTEVALLTISAVLGWPDNREAVYRTIDRIVSASTRVNGLTGEKGLAGYSTIGPRSLAVELERYAAIDRDFLAGALARHPRLRETYRFHVDTWALGAYYPSCGDSGAFAKKVESYCGADFRRDATLEPSAFAFFWRLYQATGDAAFVQVLYRANGGKVDGLPHDLLAEDPAAFQKEVAAVIAREGPRPAVASVNKQAWHLALLRSGTGADERVLWLDYDSGCGRHSHRDGMNLGLFAKGLDLMPDFGYPPVQFGGWGGRRFSWYVSTASHNTVLVDGRDLPDAAGTTTLWADGETFRAIRASAPAMAGKQYERTAALIDVSKHDSYVLDVFRVVGGSDHAKFFHSHFGTLATTGLDLKPGDAYGPAGFMRNFRTDANAGPGWTADLAVEDHYAYLPKDAEVHVRYTDLTSRAVVSQAEGWIVAGMFNETAEKWIPRLMVRRTGEAPLGSTFVSVIEPYEKRSNVAGSRRLPIESAGGKALGENHVAVEVELADGRRDLVIAIDVERPLEEGPRHPVTVQRDWGLRHDGELAFVRRSKDGGVERLALCGGRNITAGDVELVLTEKVQVIEIVLAGGGARVVRGDANLVETLALRGRSVPLTRD